MSREADLFNLARFQELEEKYKKCLKFIKNATLLYDEFPRNLAIKGVSFVAKKLLIDIGEELPNES